MEKKERGDLGQVLKRLQAEKRKLELLKKDADSACRELQRQTGTLRVGHLKQMSMYIERLNVAIENQKKEVKAQERSVDIQRERLMKAIQEKKIYEKLKERHFKSFMINEERQEQKRLDERSAFEVLLKQEGKS